MVRQALTCTDLPTLGHSDTADREVCNDDRLA